MSSQRQPQTGQGTDLMTGISPFPELLHQKFMQAEHGSFWSRFNLSWNSFIGRHSDIVSLRANERVCPWTVGNENHAGCRPLEDLRAFRTTEPHSVETQTLALYLMPSRLRSSESTKHTDYILHILVRGFAMLFTCALVDGPTCEKMTLSLEIFAIQ